MYHFSTLKHLQKTMGNNVMPADDLVTLKTQGIDRDDILWKTVCICISLQWRHNGRDGVSNHQPHHCLLNRLIRRRSKKTSKLRVTDLCAGNSQVTGEFPAQMTSNTENISIWWRHNISNPFLTLLQYILVGIAFSRKMIGCTFTSLMSWLLMTWSHMDAG